MLNISPRIESLFKQNYQSESEEFKKGFLTCFMLLDIAIEKHTMHNYAIMAREQKKRIEELERLQESHKELIRKLSTTKRK